MFVMMRKLDSWKNVCVKLALGIKITLVNIGNKQEGQFSGGIYQMEGLI